MKNKRNWLSILMGMMLALGVASDPTHADDADVVKPGEIHTEVPTLLRSDAKYLFYVHGAWLETNDANRRHPEHGLYEYDRIVQAFADKGFEVISEKRFTETDPDQYAMRLMHQAERLLGRGVQPQNITVVGHSKGGQIALQLAASIHKPKMNFVILAGCWRRGTQARESYERFLDRRAGFLDGRILSIYDAGDRAADSCEDAFDRAMRAETKEELLVTGLGHGLFYSPRPEWVSLASKWGGL